MAESTGAKTKVYLGTTALTSAPDAASDFTSATYTELASLMTIGQYGDNVADVSYNLLRNGRTSHIAGLKDGGTVDLVLAYNASDAGQALISGTIYGSASNLWPIKIEFTDGEVNYMTFAMLSNKVDVGDGSSLKTLTATIGISSEVFVD